MGGDKLYTLQVPKTTVKDPEPQILPIEKWAGVNQFVTPSAIQDNEFAYAQNMQLTDDGLPDKRNGFEQRFGTSLGSGKINGAYKALYNGYIVFAWNTGIYKLDPASTAQPVKIYDSLTSSKAYFFTMSTYLFLMNGTDFVRIDSSFNVVTVASVAYIPTTIVGRAPAGGGSVFEAVNMMQPLRYNSFVGTTGATAYTLDSTGLDATLITAVVNGVAKVETTDFTVNRTTGVVTFAIAPGAPSVGGIDNVKIKFGVTVSGYAEKVTKCTIQPELFGGDNDTRVFIANGNTRYHSGLLDATYWPDLNYTKIGSDQCNITRLSQQGDTQVIFKEHKGIEPSIWNSRYNLTTTTNSSGVIVTSTVTYPVFPINGIAGADAKDCCEIVLNNPTFLDTTDGVYSLTTTNVRDQRDITRQSDRINKSLLAESNLQNAISFLWQYRFGICVNGNAYVWDFRLNAWLGKWTNINASCFMQINSELYFGSSTDGMIYKFNSAFSDNGTAIQCYVLTKYFSFGKAWVKKLMSKIYVDLKSAAKVSTTVSYTTDVKSTPKYLPIISRYLFDYSLVDYSKWTYGTNLGFPKAIMRKIREKGLIWIQFKYENNNLDESMPLTGTQYEYLYQSPTKSQ